ncbi:anoctamin 8 [Echinococcus multilocularis]|uniref:Anoctamin n=1 Tax=Echinococcus multilocularis TaxID=6211 RepID=A0A068YC97_ECHMU|nr:anoctamin 8 [Echinococcus multilocularis]
MPDVHKYKERFTDFRHRVAYTGRELLERSRKWRSFSTKSPSNCDVVVTFKRGTSESQVDWISNRLQARIPELLFTKTFHSGTQRPALYLTCSFNDLLKGSREVRLRKRLASEFGGEMQEFCIEDCENFEGFFDHETFFTSSERQTIVRYYLMSLRAMAGDAWDDDIKFSQGQAIMPVLLAAGKIATIFPLHDREALAVLHNSWVRGFTHRQPLDAVAEYFGVKIALYFAWLGHYTTALLIPAIFGLLCWFIVPAGKERALHYPVLAFFTMLWAVFFQEVWKRTSNHYTYHWGTLDKLPSLLEQPRPLFRGALEPSPITGRLEPFYPRWKRNLIVCFVTFPMTLVCLLFVVVVAIAHIKLQEYADVKSSSWRFRGATLVPFLPMILYGVNINILNAIYHKIAVHLTEMENHRLDESYNNALISKLILFQFINAFYASFYIAFYRMDLALLRHHLVTILVIRQIAGNLKEVFLPLGQTRVRQVYLSLRADGFPSLKKDDLHTLGTEASDGKSSPNKSTETKITQAEQEEIMPKYDDATNDYLEMFIQFGFVSMFTCVFPICGLLAFLNNILEIRSDAFKLLTNFQRPFSETARGIGVWERAFEIVSYVAIAVNIGLIGVSGSIQALFPGLTTYQYILLLIAVEHILFALRFGLSHIVPPIPFALERSIAILEHKRREALRTLERECRKEARRVSDENDSPDYPSDQTSDIDTP